MCGGNINSKLWFCGIEWTDWIDWTNLEVAYKIQSELFPNKGHFIKYKDKEVEIPFVTEEWEKKNPLRKSQFDQKIAKILLSYLGKHWDKRNKYNFEHYHNYMQNRLYRIDGDIFKLNLYPLDKQKLSTWDVKMSQRTGCITAFEYYAKCIEYRFPLIKSLTDKYSPDVVVCIGNEHMNEYIAAFWGREILRDKNGDYSEIVPTEKFPLSNNLSVSVYSTKTPILIGLPFLGRQLLSDVDMIAIGSLLHSYTKPTA